MAAALPILALMAVPATAVPNPDDPVLAITPTPTEVPADVIVRGSCPAVGFDDSLEEYEYPSSARLVFPAANLTVPQTVTLDSGGEIERTFSLPGTLAPGQYEARLFCDSSEVEVGADVTVRYPEIPASLGLDRVSARVDEEVTATGTCPRSTGETDLRVNERTVSSAVRIDPDTGDFGPVVFALPPVPVGPALVTTTCGGSETLTVVLAATTPPSTPPTPSPTTPATTPSRTIPQSTTGPAAPGQTVTPTGPTDARIPVPDLTGLTEAEAVEKLSGSLVLGNPTGEDGRIREQNPPAGTLVEPASAITVVLEDPPEPSSFPLLLVAVLVGAMIGALLYSDRLRRRRHRERRWVDSQVRTDVRLHEAEVPAVPDPSVAGLDLRLEVRRDPARLQFQEVGDVQD